MAMLVAGALYFNSTDNEMRVYDGGSWIAASSAGGASLLEYNYTATAGQTTFSGADDNAATLAYVLSNLIVTLNGIVLENGTDYTATNGTSIVLTDAAAVDDELNVVAFKSFTTADMVPASTGGTFTGNVSVTGDLTVDTNTLVVDSTNNRVGINKGPTPDNPLDVYSSSAGTLAQFRSQDGTNNPRFSIYGDSSGTHLHHTWSSGAGNMIFEVGGSAGSNEKMRIDSSGSVLVGMTSGIGTFTNAGVGISSSSNYIHAIRDGNIPLFVGRKTSDGEIIRFYKDGTTVGAIGVSTGLVYFGQGDTNLMATSSGNQLLPRGTNGANRDNAIDLGSVSNRFDDIYATNGTIQTSDQNEKQQIASLTNAEITAAKAISKLFKTFKWNDSVAENGDNARTHTGVIAQDVQQAYD